MPGWYSVLKGSPKIQVYAEPQNVTLFENRTFVDVISKDEVIEIRVDPKFNDRFM